MALLFFTVILGSCGQSKERKAVCDAYDEINKCANEADVQVMNTCAANAAKKAANKLDGKKLKLSQDQLTEVANATLDFQTCVTSATSDFRTSSTPTTGATKMADKLKEIKKCVGGYTGKVKGILECE